MDQIAPEFLKVLHGLAQGREPWPLYVYGPPGCGKTCAALSLLDYVDGIYRPLPDLLDTLIELQHGRLLTRGPANEGGGMTVTSELFWREVERADLYVLDELGCRASVSEHHFQTVKRILDRREGKPLIVISNLDLDAIESLYDDRIVSRLAAGTLRKLTGDDRRLRSEGTR